MKTVRNQFKMNKKDKQTNFKVIISAAVLIFFQYILYLVNKKKKTIFFLQAKICINSKLNRVCHWLILNNFNLGQLT